MYGITYKNGDHWGTPTDLEIPGIWVCNRLRAPRCPVMTPSAVHADNPYPQVRWYGLPLMFHVVLLFLGFGKRIRGLEVLMKWIEMMEYIYIWFNMKRCFLVWYWRIFCDILLAEKHPPSWWGVRGTNMLVKEIAARPFHAANIHIYVVHILI